MAKPMTRKEFGTLEIRVWDGESGCEVDDGWNRIGEAIHRLEELEAKLPITADGVRVIPQRDKVYHPEYNLQSGQWFYSERMQIWNVGFYSHPNYYWREISDCYSTLELAQAAAKEKE